MIETERLKIRHFSVEDTKACYLGWGQDQTLGRFILGYPMEHISQMEAFVENLTKNKNAWIFEEKRTGNVIGYGTMDIPYDILSIGEIGYVIGEKFQRRGFAYEALAAMIDKYFTDEKLYLIEAKYNEKNIPSGNLLMKLGFQAEASLRGRRIDCISGERNNLVIASLLNLKKL